MTGPFDFDTPKSKAGIRNVPIPNFLAVELKAHMETFTGPLSTDFIFTTNRGAPLSRRTYGLALRPILDDLGMSHVRPHDLRHAAQTFFAQVGNVAETMNRMGHSSVAAMAIYMHSTQENGRDVAQRLDAMHAEGLG